MTRLVLTRKVGETIIVHKNGEHICSLSYVKPGMHNQIRLAFDASPDIDIDREEIFKRKYPDANC